MKLSFYFLLFAGILFSTMAQATVLRVDNNPGASANYVRLQDAINNAEEGDSIYVVGSPNWYDVNANGSPVEIRINKQVTIIGPGYFLGQNTNTQVSKQIASIYRINIGEGANGTVLTGLNLGNVNSTITINRERFDGSQGTNGPSNLRIYRNNIEHIYIVYGENTLVSQNYFNTSGSPIWLYEDATGTVITNNIILASSNSATIYCPDDAALVNTVISNNTINNGLNRINNTTIQNNIFISGTISNNCDNNTLRNNLFTTTQDAVIGSTTGNTLTDNIYSAVQANLFVVPTPTFDNEYRLADNSPAVAEGVNGEDLGAFGGATPYKAAGIPSIPAIYDLSTSGVGTTAEGMQVQIKAKTNN